ncbi:heavy metal-associated isoprenylated plant protein 43-like [Phoenix dactylifera]|uniref:Heavy metal-associated isoprenylated plant protein 43-like n=1 Tax=Phoenix dactylifera TaxID=42345 RepID=A0A8B7CBZ5_PHODC|nr:heavy metal-associated isoprenylated plant protein 43-like [Phoenix dactylifera]
MVKRTVLKVDLSCQKCKQKLVHAVSGLEGVDKIEVDGAKSTLTVTGDADPIEVIARTRKVGKSAEVVSIGPPPPPPPPPPKLVQEKKPEQQQTIIHMPPACPACQQMGIGDAQHSSCSIL